MQSASDMETTATDETATHMAEPARAPIKQPEPEGLVKETPAAPAEAASVTPANTPTNESPAPTSQKQEPVKAFGITMPSVISGPVKRIQDFGARWRKGAIEKAPRVVVNRSSNIIGFIQLIAEALMFKSGGFDLIDYKKPQKIHWEKQYATWAERPLQNKIIHHAFDPIKNILDGVFKKGGLGTHPLQMDFYKAERLKAIPGKIAKLPEAIGKLPGKIAKIPENVSTGFKRLQDTKSATFRDRIIGADGKALKMTNKWSARSGFAGLCAMTIAMILPDKKDTPEETEKYALMSRQNPVRYAATRFYQAINPIQWWNHKRQFSGLGMMCAGILSFVSGFRQVAGDAPKQLYMKNRWQMAGGLITAMGGTQLMMAIDNDSGWRNFGLIQMLRLAILPNSITTRFKGIKITDEMAKEHGFTLDGAPGKTKTFQEQGAAYYLGAQSFLQAKNVFAASLGGAEKREDGTIVDHSEMRKEAKEKAKSAVAARREAKRHHTQADMPVADAPAEHSSLTVDKDGALVDTAEKKPATHVSHAKDVAPAMPERVTEHHEKHAATASA